MDTPGKAGRCRRWIYDANFQVSTGGGPRSGRGRYCRSVIHAFLRMPPLAAVEQVVDLAGVKAGLVEIEARAGWRLQLLASSSSSNPH